MCPPRPYPELFHTDTFLALLQRSPETYLLPLTLVAAPTIGLAWYSRRRGLAPNLAGWLAGPLLGAALALAWSRPIWIEGAGVETRWTLYVATWNGAASLVVALIAAGLMIGAASLTRRARAAGLSVRLACLGAIGICLGGVAEAHRLLVWAWTADQVAVAYAAWDTRTALLTAALGLALAAPVLSRLVGERPAPAQRAGVARATLLIAGFAGVFFWSARGYQDALDGLTGAEGALGLAPQGSGTRAVVSVDAPYPTWRPVGAIDARYLHEIP